MPTTVATPADIAKVKAAAGAAQATADEALTAAQAAQLSHEETAALVASLIARIEALEKGTHVPDPEPEPEDPTDPGTLPAGVTLRQLDGGPKYNAKFSPGLPATPDFFPIAVWHAGVSEQYDVDHDKATGINVYAGINPGGRLDLVKAAGMYAFPWLGETSPRSTETVGYCLEDEPDMLFGWWLAPHAQQIAHMDQKLADRPKDGRANYTNYGLGILARDDNYEPAKTFVKKYSDYISVDYYFYTADAGGFFEASRAIGKGEARLTAEQTARGVNYGIVVQRMRRMADYTKPVWGFVEVGFPFGANVPLSEYITPNEVRAAIWHSIIGGAQGIILFNHSFGGDAQTHHALREPYYAPIRKRVQEVTAVIRELAPALNSPEAVGLTTVGSGGVAITRWNGGKPVVIAGNVDNVKNKSVPFTVKGAKSVEVVGEGRTITPSAAGQFTDTFADGTSIHIYKVTL